MARSAATITFREGVKIEEIHQAVERFVRAHGPFGPGGCAGCGLVGIDIALRAVADPEPYTILHSAELRDLPGVVQVSLDPEPSPW